MIEPPYDGLKVLKEYAEKHDMGMGSAMDENCVVILMGKKDKLHINEVAVICASMLLQGVLNGHWNSMDIAAKETNDPQSSDHTH